MFPSSRSLQSDLGDLAVPHGRLAYGAPDTDTQPTGPSSPDAEVDPLEVLFAPIAVARSEEANEEIYARAMRSLSRTPGLRNLLDSKPSADTLTELFGDGLADLRRPAPQQVKNAPLIDDVPQSDLMATSADSTARTEVPRGRILTFRLPGVD